jgi:predicted acetyltransferase
VEPEIRPIEPDEFPAFLAALEAAFSSGHDEKFDRYVELERAIAVPERCLAAFDDGRIVGGNCSVPMTITVPGGSRVAMSGVNGVGVLPTHTRRGISTALMRRQLDETRDRGEPVSALHASEAAIYGRYGFGLGTREAKLDVERRQAAFVRGYEPRGTIELADREAAEPALREVTEQALDRPGMVGPVERYLPYLLGDIDLDEDDKPYQVVHRDEDGRPDAAAIYRVKHDWSGARPRAKTTVYHLSASSHHGLADVWRYLLDLDLVETVSAWNRPVDDPVFRLVREPRALGALMSDGVWLRLVDLTEALEARGYSDDGRVVMRIEDRFCPWNDGTWELVVDGGRATVGRSRDEPDLACGINDVGAIYLGDATFHDLVAALQVRELEPGAVERADRMFASDPSPWCWLGF